MRETDTYPDIDLVAERIAKIRKMAAYFAGSGSSGMTWWEYRSTVTADMLWLIDHIADVEAYAKEGWDWLSEALDALGVKDVFEMREKAKNPSFRGQEKEKE